jgi:alpha-beta hydrolase superfamily lysophospholipase
MYVTLILFGFWLAANLVHYAWVRIRRACWERRVSRDADELLPQAAPFAIGTGPIALLMIHGFADTPRLWQRMADRLATKGTFTCRAMLLPGSAQPLARAKHQSLPLWRQAIDDELDRLHATHPAVWVVGHSLGGALALDAALRHPQTVAGAAVLAPMIAVSRKRSPLFPPAVWFGLASVLLCLSPTFESCFSADNTAADDPSFVYTKDRFIPFCVYRGLFQLIRANRDQAVHLTCPVFAATAELDSVVDTPATHRWFARCSSPKRIRAIPEIRHVIPLENGWQVITDDLADFIVAQA